MVHSPMRSPRPLLALASAAAILLGPALAARSAPRDSSAHLRFGGDVTVPAGTREGAVVVVRGDATIAGEVRGVVVLEGDAFITGGRVQELTVVNGRAILTDSARVEGDVHLLDAELTVEPGSVVAGTIERGVGRQVAGHFLRAMTLIGLGIFLAFVLGGVFAASVFPESLRATGALLRGETGAVTVATAILWLGFPLVAGLLIPTLVGLPIGLGYFLFVMPLLGFLGLVVSGLWVGDLLMQKVRATTTAPRPTVATAVGVALLLVLARIPVLGLAATVLTLLGSGAAALRTWRAMRAHA
jgi:hypothetical protein